MSSAERFVRHHKRQTDRAISQAYGQLAADPRASATFRELLDCVRRRAPGVFAAPAVDGHRPGVEALVNLSRHGRDWVRPAASWSGTSASWRGAVCALAQHLVCRYRVPRFLAGSWYATDAFAQKKREWFMAHARGTRFRSLDLPIPMTRRMEHIFLASADHLSIEQALRRSELLALGASADLIDAVLATRMGTDLLNGVFWRSVWMFLVAHSRAIEAAHVGPLIDFVHAIRHESVAVDTTLGIVMRDPPRPTFSMRGRTPHSMLRLMRDWHRRLGLAHGGLAWHPAPLQPMRKEEPSRDACGPPVVWQLIELVNSEQLREEGAALRHCVARYAHRCRLGESRIWSLRVSRGAKVRRVLTVEVDIRRRAVIQARGWGNKRAAGKSLRLLEDWSRRERLHMAL